MWPEGQNLLDFPSCGRCSRLTTGTSGTRSGGLMKGQSPGEFLGGPSGFLSRLCRGLRPCVESGPEHDYCSPVLTWILGYFCSLPRGVSPRLEWACTCAFLQSGSSSVTQSAAWSKGSMVFPRVFPRGFPTTLSHRAVPRAHVVGVDPRLERQGSAGKTGSSGMD